jgi:hypothetical protein
MKMKAFIVGVGLLSRVVIDVDGIEDEEEKKKNHRPRARHGSRIFFIQN